MKIIHLCLACFYIDGYAYQENILPKCHKEMGHEVYIIASTQTYLESGKLGFTNAHDYINEDGIKVSRLLYKNGPKQLLTRIRTYQGLYKKLEDIAPDFIFIHDVQFWDLREVVRYKKRHPQTNMVADGHTDYLNSAKGFFSKWFLHGLFYKSIVRSAIPYIETFYGTLPCRCTFMKEMYHIPETKLKYLPFGVDDCLIKKLESRNIRQLVRNRLGIKEDEFVLVTGGKFNKSKKGIFTLINAICEVDIPIRLLIFGNVTEDIREEFERSLGSEKIVYTGWANVEQSYEYMSASDAAIFPNLHSTLWEQAAGLGLPCIIRYIEGYTHLNVCDNCILVEEITSDNLAVAIKAMYKNIEYYTEKAKCIKDEFSYFRISESVLPKGNR